MDHRSVEDLYVVVAPGLEEVCAAELAGRGMTQIEPEAGGVAFRGRLEQLYLANLWLRTASRVVVRFAAFRCRSFPDLYRQALRLPWGRFIRRETALEFRVTCRRSRLMQSQRIADTLEQAAGRVLGGAAAAGKDTVQLVLVRVIEDHLSISIDSSGELLHRRGYRQASRRAPLRETLAAGILLRLGWDGSVPLVDPMCGTGTFVLEAAALAAGRAPGIARSFAFQNWPGYRQGLWQRLCAAAADRQAPIEAALVGFDREPAAVAAARENLARLDISGPVDFARQELAEQRPPAGPGLLICNPPYGRRLRVAGSLVEFYREIGRLFDQNYRNWRVAMLCPDPHLVQATALPLTRIAGLRNGGIKVGLYFGDSRKRRSTG